MKNILKGIFLSSIILIAVAACAQPIVHHNFSFGNFNGKENQGIKILDYRYGDDDKSAPTRPDADQLASGHIPQFLSIGTFAPPGNYLYVKWRVLSTGKVYEDTVDLKPRLPWDMNNKEIHFTIEGAQLHVYLIASEHHETGKPYKRKCESLYPERLPDCGSYDF